MSNDAIQIHELCKTYAGGKRALDNVSLSIPQGKIFGLLGPNGAGKSTLINIIAGTVRKSSGSVNIWGFDLDINPRNASASIGIVPQELLFDPFFTPAEALDVQAGLYGVPKHKRRTKQLLEAMHLSDKADAYSRSLSGGMKRRLLIAKALVHSPPILILDEPTAGVDIELRKQLWSHVMQLNEAGVTIVLTTHYLEEAEELCDQIAIIDHGQVIANKPTRELVNMTQEKIIELTLDRPCTLSKEDLSTLSNKFDHIEQRAPDLISVTYNRSETNAGEVMASIHMEGYEIIDVSTREPDLEHVFLNLTQSREGAAVHVDKR